MMQNLKHRFCAFVAAALCLCLCSSALAAEITGSSTPESLSVSGNVTFTFTIHNDSAATMTDIRILYKGSEFFTTAGAAIEPGASQSFTSSPLTVQKPLNDQPIKFEET